MELVLLQETSITLTELDQMNEERKWKYYYFIQAQKKKELREMEEKMEEAQTPNGKRRGVTLPFPDDFVSVLDNRAAIDEIWSRNLKDVKEKMERKK